MTTVGFNFTKIYAEKKRASEQNIRIENNVGIIGIKESNVVDPKKSLLRFEFNFVCKYEPGLGLIELKGELVELYDKELAGKILLNWNAEKKVSKEIMAGILNNILHKSNVQAIILSRDLGLPTPIAMPKLEVKQKDAFEKEKSQEKPDAKKPEDKKNKK